MNRWWLVLGLMLSVGINLGLLASRLLPAGGDKTADVEAADVEAGAGNLDAAGSGDRADAERPSGSEIDSSGPLFRRPQARSPDGRPTWNANGAPPMLQRMIQRMADELDVEDASREAFFEQHREFFRQTFEARLETQRLQESLRHELMAREPDREAIDRLLDELAETQSSLERAFVDNLLDVRELLGPEQEMRYMRFMARIRQGQRGGPGRIGPGREGFRPRRP